MPQLRLNKNRPSGQVFGEPGIAWQQDGRYFRQDGSLVGEPVDVAVETLTTTRPPRGSREEEAWLRSQMAIYDEPWTTIGAARRFLVGKDD